MDLHYVVVLCAVMSEMNRWIVCVGCAVVYCVVLCCAVLCGAVLCCVVLCCVA